MVTGTLWPPEQVVAESAPICWCSCKYGSGFSAGCFDADAAGSALWGHAEGEVHENLVVRKLVRGSCPVVLSWSAVQGWMWLHKSNEELQKERSIWVESMHMRVKWMAALLASCCDSCCCVGRSCLPGDNPLEPQCPDTGVSRVAAHSYIAYACESYSAYACDRNGVFVIAKRLSAGTLIVMSKADKLCLLLQSSVVPDNPSDQTPKPWLYVHVSMCHMCIATQSILLTVHRLPPLEPQQQASRSTCSSTSWHCWESWPVAPRPPCCTAPTAGVM